MPERYDDGGFTGANLDRPALQRLMAQIQLGRIDCVIVYKVDRLSRSLLDFAQLIQRFDRHGVSFVSVTQQFNTSTSMGRLILHVLLSFAQFERELISERTRDKMGAARRKGQWLGSPAVLGYDGDRDQKRLVVNAAEAQRVRSIFELFLHCGSLAATVEALSRRGWVTKRLATRRGTVRGGRRFTKASLHFLLSNVTYTGHVKYKGQIYEGQHEAIISQTLFDQVQAVLRNNRRCPTGTRRRPLRGLLQGILYCAACEHPMGHTYTCKGNLRYRYYTCPRAQKRGGKGCPTGRIPAPKVERLVLDELKDHLAESDEPLNWPHEDETRQAMLLRHVVPRVEYRAPGGDLTIHIEMGNILASLDDDGKLNS